MHMSFQIKKITSHNKTNSEEFPFLRRQLMNVVVHVSLRNTRRIRNDTIKQNNQMEVCAQQTIVGWLFCFCFFLLLQSDVTRLTEGGVCGGIYANVER